MSHMPDWVFGASCAVIAKRYVMGMLPVDAYTNSFAQTLSRYYGDASSDRLMAGVEGILRFLMEIEDADIEFLCDSFIYNRTCFDENGNPRKIKGLFRSALAPAKQRTGVEATIKAFRAFVFRLRANPDLRVPPGWDIDTVADIDWLGEMFKQKVEITDAL